MIYRAAASADLLSLAVEGFTLVYDRRSGQTHLLASPLPQLLAALSHGPADVGAIVDRLARDFDIAEDKPAVAMQARLDELCGLGLVETVAAGMPQ